jgi:hypothetical protein
MMWERCEEILAGHGNPTVRDARVDRLFHRDGHVTHATTRSADGSRTDYDGDHFISTMPLRTLIRGLYPEPPESVRAAAEELRYRDYLTVVLIVDREDVFPDNWIYVHDPTVKMGRIQNYKNWSPEMVPDTSRTALGLEYFLWESDEEWTWSDDRLIELGIRECEQIGLARADEVRDATVVRMKKAYPVYDARYRHNVDLIAAYLRGFENLQTIGRNGLHRYNNQDHSMLTGILAARNVLGESNDVWSVNTEMDYHEEERRGDGGDRLVPRRIPVDRKELEEAEEVIEELLLSEVDPVAFGSAIGLTTGLIVFLATAALVLKGGPDPGPNLALLAQFFWNYSVSWAGAFVGLAEAGLGFFMVGYALALIRNATMRVVVGVLQQSEETDQQRKLLQ